MEILSSLEHERDLALFLAAEREALMTEWTSQGGGRTWMRRHTDLIDNVVRRLFALAAARQEAADGQSAASHSDEETPQIAIVATGGYGRRELSPHSDLDITFLPSRDDDSYLNGIIKEMFRLVMDVFLSGARIKVGYAYRLLSDYEGLDHQTQTALLDARCVAGSQELFAQFDRVFRERLQRTDFVFQKYAERNATLDKNGVSPYTVEPNVKEGAGGLRDLQSAEWVAEVRWGKRTEALWHDLVRRKVVTSGEASVVQNTREFLFTVRNGLHLITGDARDTLTAERQETLAARLGYEEEDASSPETPGVERFMREYYHRVAQVHHISNKILVRCLNSPLPLGSGLGSVRRSVTVTEPEEAAADPLWPLRALRACQTYDLDLALPTEEAIQRHVAEFPALPDPHQAGALFLELLAQPRNVYWALRQMLNTGLLEWLLPELAACIDLIPYDPTHEHTVGEHTLLVLRNLERLRGTTDPSLAPYRRLLEEVHSPESLYLAALLHDIGKQWTGKHAETGAERAAEICGRLGYGPEITDRVVFLVRQHLLMAETSRLRDLALDETVRDFTRVVRDEDRLRMLYLLTYADTSAVGKGVWTEVKARFLEDLYSRAEAALSDPEEEPRTPNVQAFRERVRRQLAREKKLTVEAIHEHTAAMPAPYLLNTSLEDMYLHMAMIARVRENYRPMVDSRTPFGSDYTELTVVAYDDPVPGLLAKIAGALFAHDVNLHSAQVFTRNSSDRIAIDTLWVDYRGKPLSPHKRGELEDTFRQVLTGEMTVAQLLTKRGKTSAIVQPVRSLLLDDQTSPNYSILDVVAPDERGVVYRLASSLSAVGWNIHSARLATWGGNARNAYYITDIQNCKVPAEAAELLRERLPLDEKAGVRSRAVRASGAAVP